MKFTLRYRQYAEKAILIEWPTKVDDELLEDLLSYKKYIEKELDEVIVEVISSYNSLLVCYLSTIEDIYSKVFELKSLYNSDFKAYKSKNRLWKIPVCYSITLAPDLDSFAQEKSLFIQEVIDLHTSPVYRVYFVGFLPGFLYLGGLDNRLHLPRKTSPSLRVKKGAVAIGGSQTGIYPTDSPGGWHVIGSCPLSFFDVHTAPPCSFESGDYIRFISITERKYNEISQQVLNNVFELKPLIR